tara:strand:- start:2275 stop:2880 length:606 start_codon:yes stop_codon:yes gene_type:complete
MAKAPSPWSVKGVDPEAREAAKIAARRAGLTVGAWLNQMILQTASDQLRRNGTQQPGAAPGYRQPERAEYRQQPDPQTEHWDTPHPQPGMAPPPAPTIQAVFESIQRLSSRIEQAEQRTADTIAPIVDKVAELSDQLEKTKNSGGTSTAPVERAVQKIADRLDRIESESPQSESSGLSARRPIREERSESRKGFLGLFRKS